MKLFSRAMFDKKNWFLICELEKLVFLLFSLFRYSPNWKCPKIKTTADMRNFFSWQFNPCLICWHAKYEMNLLLNKLRKWYQTDQIMSLKSNMAAVSMVTESVILFWQLVTNSHCHGIFHIKYKLSRDGISWDRLDNPFIQNSTAAILDFRF